MVLSVSRRFSMFLSASCLFSCVVPPIQEMRLAVSGLVECVCSVVLCVKCEMGCELQVV